MVVRSSNAKVRCKGSQVHKKAKTGEVGAPRRLAHPCGSDVTCSNCCKPWHTHYTMVLSDPMDAQPRAIAWHAEVLHSTMMASPGATAFGTHIVLSSMHTDLTASTLLALAALSSMHTDCLHAPCTYRAVVRAYRPHCLHSPCADCAVVRRRRRIFFVDFRPRFSARGSV